MLQGEIYLINFDPSVGMVMPISSKIETWQEPDIFIARDSKNRLANDSVIRVRQISSFDTQRFIKRIGEANSPVLRKIRGYLRKHFAL